MMFFRSWQTGKLLLLLTQNENKNEISVVNILLVLFSWSLSLTYDWFLNYKCIASMVPNQCMLSSSMKYEVCFFR